MSFAHMGGKFQVLGRPVLQESGRLALQNDPPEELRDPVRPVLHCSKISSCRWEKRTFMQVWGCGFEWFIGCSVWTPHWSWAVSDRSSHLAKWQERTSNWAEAPVCSAPCGGTVHQGGVPHAGAVRCLEERLPSCPSMEFQRDFQRKQQSYWLTTLSSRDKE